MTNNKITHNPLPSIAILSGGLATRLYPITKDIPKSLININGRPFIDYQIKLLIKKGITKIVFCLNYLGEHIIDYLNKKNFDNLEIKYSWDGKEPLGTGGALKKALPLLDNDFFVLYGDSYLNIDYKSMYNAFISSKNDAMLAVYKNNNKWDKSNTIVKDGRVIFHSKTANNKRMHYIDYGLSVLSKKYFLNQPKRFDLSLLYESLTKQNNLDAFIAKERFFEIGSKKGIDELTKQLLINN